MLVIKKIIVGLIAGIISGLFASGGGLIIVPALVYIFKMQENQARATSIYTILPMALVSGIFYYNADFIKWDIGIKCAIGGIIGAIIGAVMLKKMSSNILKIFFIIFLIYISIKMLLS